MSKKATEAVCMISTEKGKMLTVSARTRKYFDLNAARSLKEKGLSFYLIFSYYFSKSVSILSGASIEVFTYYRVEPPNVTRIWINRLFGQAQAVGQFLPFLGYVWCMHVHSLSVGVLST